MGGEGILLSDLGFGLGLFMANCVFLTALIDRLSWTKNGRDKLDGVSVMSVDTLADINIGVLLEKDVVAGKISYNPDKESLFFDYFFYIVFLSNVISYFGLLFWILGSLSILSIVFGVDIIPSPVLSAFVFAFLFLVTLGCSAQIERAKVSSRVS